MFFPSQIKSKPSDEVVIKKTSSAYVFDDAYIGTYEFFEGRPVCEFSKEDKAVQPVVKNDSAE